MGGIRSGSWHCNPSWVPAGAKSGTGEMSSGIWTLQAATVVDFKVLRWAYQPGLPSFPSLSPFSRSSWEADRQTSGRGWDLRTSALFLEWLFEA